MAIKLFQFEQCDQNGRFLNGLAKKFLHKKNKYLLTFEASLKNLNFYVELVWLLFGQFLEILGYLLSKHLATQQIAIKWNSNSSIHCIKYAAIAWFKVLKTFNICIVKIGFITTAVCA